MDVKSYNWGDSAVISMLKEFVKRFLPLPMRWATLHNKEVMQKLSSLQSQIDRQNRTLQITLLKMSVLHLYITREMGDAHQQSKFMENYEIDISASDETAIPIVMAADENYAMPMCVAMNSILESKAAKTNYIFYLMIPEKFQETACAKYDELLKRYPGTTIEYLVMGSLFADISLHIPHITTPTYYRLLISEMLLNYDKCIYLDADVLICDDLTELYNFDLGSNYIAGVKAAGYHLPDGNIKYCEKIGIPSIDQYVNAGVLLLNLRELRVNGIHSKFVELTSKHMPTQDQDIINIVCYNHIAFLPFKYNAMPKLLYEKITEQVFSVQEIEEARSNPVIIHYADKLKPWNGFFGPFFDRWWVSMLNSTYSHEAWTLGYNMKQG